MVDGVLCAPVGEMDGILPSFQNGGRGPKWGDGGVGG